MGPPYIKVEDVPMVN